MEISQYFATRRTIRRYDPSRPVPTSLLRSLIEQATQAPNTGNMQIYSIILTQKQDIIDALAPAHFNQPAITGAKAVLTFCIDFNRFNTWCRINGAEPGLNNLQGFTWGVMDTAIVAQQFCTLAELHGLGTCYLGTTTYNADSIARTLSLPQSVVPVITVTVGYPAEDPGITPRLPVDAILHTDTYHEASAQEIKDIYAAEEALESNRRFVEENNLENLAQVFARIRYPKDANEQFSRVYREFLKNQGIPL